MTEYTIQTIEYRMDYTMEYRMKYIKNDTIWTMRSAIQTGHSWYCFFCSGFYHRIKDCLAPGFHYCNCFYISFLSGLLQISWDKWSNRYSTIANGSSTMVALSLYYIIQVWWRIVWPLLPKAIVTLEKEILGEVVLVIVFRKTIFLYLTNVI